MLKLGPTVSSSWIAFMPPAEPYSTPSPPSHLPGRLSSLEEIHVALPALTKINNMVKRLKVQAFVLLIHELFFTCHSLKTLSLTNNELSFGNFEGHEEYQDDFERMDEIARQLDLPYDCYQLFDTQQPFEREGLRDQLATAYKGALSDEQQRQGGQWDSFWATLPPIPNYVDDEPDMDDREPDPDQYGNY
jgi:hypothetical protein